MSEQDIRATDGYQQAVSCVKGYLLPLLEDCWQERARAPSGSKQRIAADARWQRVREAAFELSYGLQFDAAALVREAKEPSHV